MPVGRPKGLCADCARARPIVNDRGSRFLRCSWADVDARYPRYPRLPVHRCAAFEARVETEGAGGAG